MTLFLMEKIVNLIIKYINISSLPEKWTFWQRDIFWQCGYSGDVWHNRLKVTEFGVYKCI